MFISIFAFAISSQQMLFQSNGNAVKSQFKIINQKEKYGIIVSSSKNIKELNGGCGKYAGYYFTTKTGTISISGSGDMNDYDANNGRSRPWYSVIGSIQYIKVVNSITSISKYAFADCYNATSVDIADTVTIIDDYAFQKCKKLTYIYIPNKVTYIGKYCFSYCENLQSISFPNNIESIGINALEYCISLNEATIKSEISELPEYLFYNCYKLRTLNHNYWDKIITYGFYVFYNFILH